METVPQVFLNPPGIPPQTASEAFDALDHAHQQLVAAEVAELVAITHAADLYKIDQTAIFEGMERLMAFGHEGTPLVGEFLALEIGALLGTSPDAAIGRISDALDLRHRLPAVWDAVIAGRVRVWQAMQVVHTTGQMSLEAVTRLDQKLAHALAIMGWSRVSKNLSTWIDAADLPAARQRTQAAYDRRALVVSGTRDGHVNIWGQVDPADGIAFDQAIREIAAHHLVPDPDFNGDDFDRRRAAAVGVLARMAFGQDTLPTHTLVVHINSDDSLIRPADGVAEVEGWGPILSEQLPTFLANSKVIVRPVVHPDQLAPEDQHDPSDRLRFWVTQRNPVDVFPYGVRPARSCDLDHTRPYDPGGGPGQTDQTNLGPLSRTSHRAKTHAGWRLRQPTPGVFEWTSPAGYQYLVTPEGTTRIRVPNPVSPPDPDDLALTA